MTTPESRARETIDRLLTQAGWAVQDLAAVNLHAALGVAIREFILAPPHGGPTTCSSSTATIRTTAFWPRCASASARCASADCFATEPTQTSSRSIPGGSPYQR